MGIRVEAAGSAWVALALFCLVLPMDWLLAALTAAAIHELGHLLAVVALGGTVTGLRIGLHGALMEGTPLLPWQALCASLAGPAASFSVLLLGRWMPRTALCAAAQGLFNLLPLASLDGGRALELGCWLVFSRERGERICEAIQGILLASVVFLGIWGTWRGNLGYFPLFFSLLLVFRALQAKKSCKEGNQGVQW